MKTISIRETVIAFAVTIGVFILMAMLTIGAGIVSADTVNDPLPARYDGQCFEYLDDYMNIETLPNWQDYNEVIRLQAFLNGYQGENLAYTGVYDNATAAAVARFQMMHYNEIIAPWIAQGYTFNPVTDTGYLYLTTKRAINNIMCPVNLLPIPRLIPDTNVSNTVIL